MFFVKLIINKIFYFLIYLNYNLFNNNLKKVFLKTAKNYNFLILNIKIFNKSLSFFFNNLLKYLIIRKTAY